MRRRALILLATTMLTSVVGGSLTLGAAGLLLMVRPAHASTTFTVNSPEDFSDVNPGDGICDASST